MSKKIGVLTIFLIVNLILSCNFLITKAEILPNPEKPFSYIETNNFLDVCLGAGHQAVITSEGRVFTWGENKYGQLGDGTNVNKFTLVEITNQFELSGDEKIISISLGKHHSVALTNEGRVFTWGRNNVTQLGNGTIIDSNIPVEITAQFNLSVNDQITAVAANYDNSGAITSLGKIYTWGENKAGQLGNGSTNRYFSPVEITSQFPLNETDGVNKISIGNNFFAVSTNKGRIFTWGYNDEGQLGTGTKDERSLIPIEIFADIYLNMGEVFADISLGDKHSAAVTNYGRIFTWGDNVSGQLGDGTNIDSSVPLEITSQFDINVEEKIINVDLGNNHSAALTSSGKLYTWGHNINGQLGNGTTSHSTTPVEITSQFSETPVKVSLGTNYSATITNSGRLFIWGNLATSGKNTRQSTPVLINYQITIHNTFSFADNISAIELGYYHSAIITNEGELFTWGRNEYGQLGDGTLVNQMLPVNITGKFSFTTDEKIISVALGYNHSAVLTSFGRLFTWGRNDSGQLGDGSTNDSLIPIDITAKFNLPEDEKIMSVKLGSSQSAVVTSMGRIFTWGGNVLGQLGDGTYTNRLLPLDITDKFNLNSGEKLIDISLNSFHVIALTSSGRVFTWGGNEFGQLGDGTTVPQNLPIDITSKFKLYGAKIIKVFSGDSHTAAITNDGRLYIWGYNINGQLGDGTNIDKKTPIEINSKLKLTSGEKVIDVSLGYSFSMALTNYGRVFTWGKNDLGELGDGTIINKNTPQNITTQMNLAEREEITNISVGSNHSAVRTNTGRIFIWGGNSYGQLGDNDSINKNNPNDELNFFNKLAISDNSCGSKLKLSIYPQYNLYNEVSLIKINGTNYDENYFSFNNGRIEVIIDNLWDIGRRVEFNLDSITLKNGNVLIPEGYYSASTLIIEDTIPPTFNDIEDQKIELGTDKIAWTSLIHNEHDNSYGELLKIEVEDNVLYNTLGTYSVTVKVVDEAGNYTSKTFNVEVVLDATKPTFDDISDQIIEIGSEDIDWTTFIKNEQDNREGELTKVVVEDNVLYNTLGTYSVTVKVVDEAGNYTSKTFNVTVVLDATKPTFDDIEDQIIEAGTNIFDWTTLIKNEQDNLEGELTKVVVEDNVLYNTLGTYSVTVKVVDEAGNYLCKTFNVTVVDTTKPTFNDIGDQTIEIGSEVFDWTTLIVNEQDNSDGRLIKTIVYDYVDYNVFGRYSVTVKVTDESGNYASKSFFVEVIDTTNPTFDYIQSQKIELGTKKIDWLTLIKNEQDNSRGILSKILLESNVNYREPGIYTVKVKVVDQSGNEAKQSFTVEVVDTTKPLVTLIPAVDSIFENDNYTDMGVSIRDEQETTVTVIGGVDTTKIGQYIITYKVVDKSGNETIISRYVTVSRRNDITFVLDKAITSILVNEKYYDGQCRVVINQNDYGYCNVKSNNVDPTKAGIYTITYSFTYYTVEYTYNRYVFVFSNEGDTLILYYRKEEEFMLL